MDARFVRYAAADRHYVACRFTIHDNAATVGSLLHMMRSNPALRLVNGRWEGAGVISFATEMHAVVFHLLL